MIENKKFKIVTISDTILSDSGVARQTRYIIEHLIKTGKFQVFAISVAMHHQDLRPGKVKEYGDDVIIIPSTRYDDQNLIRQVIDMEKPDLFWIMTDPRFYSGLFQISAEIRNVCPVVWWSIWDNSDALTFPRFNKPIYDCIDFFGAINKPMFNTLKWMGYEDSRFKYIPHGVPKDKFSFVENNEALKEKHYGPERKDNFVIFYNSRNALRKRTGNCVMAYKIFRDGLPEAEREKVFFAMHTPPKDPEGQDLFRLFADFDLKGKIGISSHRVTDEIMNEYYNAADVTLIQSSEEGFGLSCLESLMCGTPVIAGKTGGLTEQLIDEDLGRTWGIAMEPDATSCIGSQQVPYILSHHFDYETTALHLRKLYEDWKLLKSAEYKKKWAGAAARESALRRFNLDNITKTWEDCISTQIEKFREKKMNRKVRAVAL